jgi:hypothetical protein
MPAPVALCAVPINTREAEVESPVFIFQKSVALVFLVKKLLGIK